MPARTFLLLLAASASSSSLKLKLVKVKRLPIFPSARNADNLELLYFALDASKFVFSKVLVPRGIVILLLPLPFANVALPDHNLVKDCSCC